jgi:exodeoxyribonuclease-3
MRLATWNVNSVRTRADRVVAFLKRWNVDVLAIQETKCRDDQFPHLVFEAAGYEVAHTGFSQWNGVAVISRVGLRDVTVGFDGQPSFGKGDVPPAVEARALGATCGPPDNSVRVWSLYIPNGRALDDPHYQYKLAWLTALRRAAAGWVAGDVPAAGATGDSAAAGSAVGETAASAATHQAPPRQIALVGDWNVAPLDTDVWDMAVFEGATHVSTPEREAFAAFAEAGFREVTREHLPAAHTYTYWDYKMLAFPKNFGMRIDFTWCTPALADRVTGVTIDRDERKGQGASDHVPIILNLV